jgi:hypothetical protein
MSLPSVALPFVPLARLTGQKYGVPEGLILATIGQESGWNRKALRLEKKIHDASYGLMQILYRTARQLGYKGERGEADKLSGLFDPAVNIDLGTKLLAQNRHIAGNWSGAISAYNGGWRPHLGFGRPATEDLSICLARHQLTGDCIKRREVKLGEYGNAEYVEAVLARWQAYNPEDFGRHA